MCSWVVYSVKLGVHLMKQKFIIRLGVALNTARRPLHEVETSSDSVTVQGM